MTHEATSDSLTLSTAPVRPWLIKVASGTAALADAARGTVRKNQGSAAHAVASRA